MLGTVRVDHPDGLVGHSDGDVIVHAVADAMLAAAGDADIGTHFPPGDSAWAGVSGARHLAEVVARLDTAGLRVVNAHAIAVCQAPRLAPYRDAMQESMSTIARAPVTVHATTTDRMGFTGRGEGIACQAVAMVADR
jgi:2-C-methyl-D-erythritol 4-phosphate cytidylyltransferase/2-C-methyl-D-erythritol 2,4-cyclodiphosphate synthase